MGTFAAVIGPTLSNTSLTSKDEEASLVGRILRGRRDLFGGLINPHFDVLRRFVQMKMGDNPDAEDVIQQTILKAFAHLDQFRFEARFRTWLIRIAVNEVAQNWRRRASRRWVGLERPAPATLHFSDPSDSALRLYERSQAAKLLRYAVSSLPKTYRVIVQMHDLEGRSLYEVAEGLCLTIGAVKSRHHRGRLRMAQILSRVEPNRIRLGGSR
jgi:RNA polymerase sigma-70 factor, ECF subfamily